MESMVLSSGAAGSMKIGSGRRLASLRYVEHPALGGENMCQRV